MVKVISALEQPILGVVRHATDWEEFRGLIEASKS
jgi:hypothetical protein